MAKKAKEKVIRPRARLARGFRDVAGQDLVQRHAAIATIRAIFDRYGFDPLETPAIEYVEALGKFLPDIDRPMGGVFAFQDDDDDWLALRYDLTAPLARMVAANYQHLVKPYRRYQVGPVYRNEKPGPGRFREFYQFDADTVGSSVMATDAELCMMVAGALEALGIERGDYLVRVNNRKVLSGVLDLIGVAHDEKRYLTVLRSIDKLDRFGLDGVRLLLGAGRKDESGAFTEGANLSAEQIDMVLAFVGAGADSIAGTLSTLRDAVKGSEIGLTGVDELEQIAALAEAGGYEADRILIDPSVVRGLGYYTGPVFEAELTFEVENEKGEVVQFGSVAGGGRYDDLVKRFTGQDVPATGISIGVDRLMSALRSRDLVAADDGGGPVVVLVMDRDDVPNFQTMTAELRGAGVRAEMYIGGSGMGAQLKYADRRKAPIAVIEGGDEKVNGQVILKDLLLGAELSGDIESREEWVISQPAQVTIARSDLVAEVQAMRARQQARRIS